MQLGAAPAEGTVGIASKRCSKPLCTAWRAEGKLKAFYGAVVQALIVEGQRGEAYLPRDQVCTRYGEHD